MIKVMEYTIPTEYDSYYISESGNVYSTKTGIPKQLNPHFGDGGYGRITLVNNGKRIKKFVHRLIAETLIENEDPKNFNIVNHIDGDKTNNSVSNLEWVNNEYNIRHANILKHENDDLSFREKYPRSPFNSEEEVMDVYNKAHSGLYTQEEIAKMYNISRRFVGEIKQGAKYNRITKHNPDGILTINELEKDCSNDFYKGDKPGIQKGSDKHNSIINEETAIDIYNMCHNDEGLLNTEIAKIFDVPTHIVSQIKNGKSWGHVTGGRKNG